MHLRLVTNMIDWRMYPVRPERRRPSETDLRLAAEAAQSLAQQIIEAGGEMPPPVLDIEKFMSHGEYGWPIVRFRAGSLNAGFAMRRHKLHEIDGAWFDDILDAAGLTGE